MRSMIRFVFLAATAAAVFATEAPPPATHPPPLSTTADLVLREIRYDGRLSDTQAKFAVDIDAESSGKGEASLALFEGDVALLPSKLPSGVRIVREGTQYRLVAEKPGKYRFKLELVAKITRTQHPPSHKSFTTHLPAAHTTGVRVMLKDLSCAGFRHPV